MAWRDQLRKASFKNSEFFVESADGSFGRRVVIHEFPQKVTPYAEDMGQKTREFSFDAFVLGDDYFSARDALLDAVNSVGPGQLIHPYLGRLYCVCTEVSLRENTRDGGLARFSLKFVETSDPTAPVPKKDATTQILEAKEGVVSSAKAAFAATWATVGYATFVAEKALHVTESVVEAVEASQKRVRGALNEVAELSFTIRKIRSNINTLVKSPSELSEQIDASFEQLLAAFQGSEGGDEDAAKFLKSLFITPAVIADQISQPALVPSQEQVATNAQAMDGLVKSLAVSYQAESLANKDWESAQEAAREREATMAVIDEAMENADDATFKSLQALRVAIAQAVPAPGSTLAQEIEIKVPRTVPSLVLAYENFGTIENEADLITRNGIQHPGFIPAGDKVKALNE